MAWTSPKLDWLTNPVNPTATDLNRIEENIDFLKTDIETKKGAIVTALDGVGIAVDITDTHAEIATAITSAEQTGVTIVPTTTNQAIPKGIFDTGGGVVTGDADLIADNIKKGVNLFGVTGTFFNSLLFLNTLDMHTQWELGCFRQDTGTVITNASDTSRLTFTTNDTLPISNDFLTLVYTQPIDLTGISSINVLADSTSSQPTGVFVAVYSTKEVGSIGVAYTSFFTTYASGIVDKDLGDITLLLDVSALSGEYYIYVGAEDVKTSITPYFTRVTAK